MAKAATSEDLKAAFEEHLEVTRGQVERLEEVFSSLEIGTRGPKCEGMAGLIEEGATLMEEDAEPAVMDAGLIAAAQKVEHYEIATYGTLVTWAHRLGHNDAAALLEQSLDEEKETDVTLTELAESEINVEAQA
jgi:ferritin-like metal-binding protein YciE